MSDKGTARFKGKRASRTSKKNEPAQKPAVASTTRSAATKARDTRSRRRPKLILIIDEDLRSTEEARSYLEAEGYVVRSSTEPVQGLQLARDERVDLVLVDITLAEMNGYQVCKSLTTGDRTFHIPVVFLTRRTEPADRLLGFLAGGSDYITKPFTRDMIVQGVGRLLRR